MNPVEYALKIDGWMREMELRWLSRTAAALQPGAIWLEVGAWKGKSWSCVALSLPMDSTIIAVDTFRGEDLEPLKYVQEHGPVMSDFIRVHEEVRAMRPDLKTSILTMRSVDAAQFVIDGSCDGIFIDGDHRTGAVLDDIRAWLPKLKPGGLLCGHDADDPNVMAALKGFSFACDQSVRGSIWCLQ